jgi:AraC-like DNA-binding protein
MSVPGTFNATQRIGAFAEFPNVLREKGVDPVRFFAGSGLDPDVLTPDTRAPLNLLIDLIDRAADETASPDIALLVGTRFTMDKHGPIGRLMRTAPTLRDALFDYVSWQYGYSSGAIVFLSHMGDETAFGFGVHVPSTAVTTHVNDFVMAVGVRMVAELTNGRVRPVEVHLSRREPEDRTIYARLLKSRPAFNRPLNCLILDGAAMRAPLASHDPVARRVLMARMDEQMVAEAGRAGQVRRAIRRALLEQTPRMPDIAHDMGIHPRTLRRRLSEEGTDFEALLDDVRQTMARELIELTDMPMGEIAHALAFASPGGFSDWFRRVYGTPPSLWPRRHPPEAAAT